jgi:hypothetical protein
MSNTRDWDVKRRDFLATGVFALGAGLPIVGAAQGPDGGQRRRAAPQAPLNVVVPPDDQIDPADAVDPVAPKGLKPNATVDARYPVSYQRSVPAACRVMTAHFHAIAQRDYQLLAKTMHFPFAIIERTDAVIVNSPADLTNAKAPASLNFSPRGAFVGDHQSRLRPGAYDMMISLEVISFDAAHVSLAMTYDRYNRHGFRTLRCDGVYCVTNNDGRWAVQMLSTIWKPSQYVGKSWPDAEQAAIRLRANHTDSYINDLDINDRPRPHRGPHASIAGGGIGNLISTAGADDPMAQLKVKGVTSRLRINNNPPNPLSLNADPAQRRPPETGPHVPKWAGTRKAWEDLGIPDMWEGRIAPDFRIIHSWSDKVHRYAGASRYNAAGELLNISMEVAAVVLGSGADWVGNGSFRYTTTHDRLNDDMD